MPRFSQETIAIIGVGIALAALNFTSTNGIHGEIQTVRAEARADRDALRAEARADRAEARADRDALRAVARADRAEARADRDALRAEARADREAFEKHISRLTEGQGALNGLVEGLSRQLTAARS